MKSSVPGSIYDFKEKILNLARGLLALDEPFPRVDKLPDPVITCVKTAPRVSVYAPCLHPLLRVIIVVNEYAILRFQVNCAYSRYV